MAVTTTKAEQKVSVSGEHITVRDLREFVRQPNDAPEDGSWQSATFRAISEIRTPVRLSV